MLELASTAVSLRKYAIDLPWTIPVLPSYSAFGYSSFFSYCVQQTHTERYSVQACVRYLGEVIPFSFHSSWYWNYTVGNETGLQADKVYSSCYMVHLAELKLSWFPSGTQHLTTVMNCLITPFIFFVYPCSCFLR